MVVDEGYQATEDCLATEDYLSNVLDCLATADAVTKQVEETVVLNLNLEVLNSEEVLLNFVENLEFGEFPVVDVVNLLVGPKIYFYKT